MDWRFEDFRDFEDWLGFDGIYWSDVVERGFESEEASESAKLTDADSADSCVYSRLGSSLGVRLLRLGYFGSLPPFLSWPNA